ncbi:MAG: lamin tail domain-containing protein [Phycisphaerae bacterium]|nr:lamin tail domain-containing protein [Phycisphaerae bacterium]
MKRLAVSLVLAVSAAVSAGAQVYPIGDLNEDRGVDIRDLWVFAEQWLHERCLVPGCEADLDGTGGVNAVDFAIFAKNWRNEGGGLLISEFMASNGSSPPLGEGELLDQDEESSDWIEIYNPTSKPVALGGRHLTDDIGNLGKWEFPDGVVIEPRAFLIVFASGKDLTDSELHTNFQLNADGDYLAMVEEDSTTVISEYDYPPQLTDVSYGMRQFSMTFIASGDTASYYVPKATDTEAQWMVVTFDDSSWDTAKTGLGFVQVQPDVIDVTNPGDVVQGVPNDGDWPDNESPPLAIDNNVNAKFLHFKGDFDPGDPPGGAGFQVTPSIGPSVVTGLTFTTANDAPERDPTAFALYGSNASINGPYTLIATDSIVDFDRASAWLRHTKNTTPITFSNNTAYYHYQLLFPAIRNKASSVAMQIGEVELLGSSAGLAASNIQEQMLNINASLWVRLEFDLSADEIGTFDVLTLQMKYEDGFVAYLNGIEVTRQNYSGAPGWNSHADGDRPNDSAKDFVTIDISNHIHLLAQGTNVLAVQALNDSASDEDFLIQPELSAATSMGIRQYFTQATPGKFNVSGAVDIVSDTKFSVDRGFYDAPFDVEIATGTADATIHYTIDGSTPSETYGLEYTSPIRITGTTCLRAMAFKPGWLSTNVDTQTYIFLDQVVRQPPNPPGFPTSWGGTPADYAMDQRVVDDWRYSDLMRDSLLSIPTMSIVTDLNNLFGATGIYDHSTLSGVAWERPASIEWINPDGSTGFQVDAGLRTYGGAFRRMDLTRKKTFRLLFKREYGPTKLDFRLFDAEDATTRFDTIILRAGANDAWNNWGGENTQYIVDEFIRRTQLALGQRSAHGTFVHLYVNGLYWGLYNPVERPEQFFAATYYEGDKAQWDAINAGDPVGQSNTTTWNAMLSRIRQGMGSIEAYQRIQGNNPDGTNNPAYDDLLDIENYTDYLFSNFWGGTGDWGGRNWYVACRRPPNATGFKFFNWDMEGAIIIWSNLHANLTNAAGAIQEPYQALKRNEEFRMLFADHAHRHLFNAGPATSEASYARYKELADEVELAIIAESARWGDQGRSTPYMLANWQLKRDYILNTYMPQRPAIVLEQLHDADLYPATSAPAFKVNDAHQHGGQISATDEISMTIPEDVIYIDTELIGEFVPVRAHVPVDDSLGQTWTGRTFVPDLNWSDGSTLTGVGYEKSSGYGSLIGTNVEDQMYGNSTSLFVRIEFDFDSGEDFDKLVLQMKYDDGFVAYLNGTRVFTSSNVTNDTPGSATAEGNEAGSSFEEFDITGFKGELVTSRNILAVHGINITTTSSDMLILPKLIGKVIDDSTSSQPIWYTLDGSDPRVQGGGRNPSALKYPGSSIKVAESRHVKARTLYNGNWSALNEAVFSVGPVLESLRITEIMYHPQNTGDPQDPNEEFIELMNVGTTAINLNLVKFTNGVDFTFPSVDLGVGELIVVAKDEAAFAAQYPEFSGVIAGQYTGSLSNGGERVELEDALGQTIHNFRYRDGWFATTDGLGFSLTIRDANSTDPNDWDSRSGWRTSAWAGGSPGWDDSGIALERGTVVINEVLAHSHDEAPDWIELHNTTNEFIDIGGWFLSDNDPNFMKYEIAEGTLIDPCGYFVLYEDPNFGVLTDPGTHDPFALSENGETVYLHVGLDGELGSFMDQEDFGASETGVSFGRYVTSTGDDKFPAMDHITPRLPNAYPKIGPVVITEIMYHPTDPCLGDPYTDDDDFEYIELYNITGSTVTLEEEDNQNPGVFVPWWIRGIGFTFPPSTTIPAYSYLVVARNRPAFVHRYGSLGAGVLFAEDYYDSKLDNGGESIQLAKPGDEDLNVPGNYYPIRAERVEYSDGSHPFGNDPWPIGPDGWGYSLTRTWPNLYGNDPNNWTAELPSPGLVNPDPTSY